MNVHDVHFHQRGSVLITAVNECGHKCSINTTENSSVSLSHLSLSLTNACLSPIFFLSVSTSFFNVCLSSVLICLPVCLFLSHSALFLCFSSTSPRLFYFPPLSYSFCLSAPPRCLSVSLSASPPPPPSRGRWCVGGCL